MNEARVDLEVRAEKSYKRFLSLYNGGYGGTAEREGRLLQAAVCHARLSGNKKEADEIYDRIEPLLNYYGCLGVVPSGKTKSQDLYGHGILLGAVCSYAQLTGDMYAKRLAARMVETMYLPYDRSMSRRFDGLILATLSGLAEAYSLLKTDELRDCAAQLALSLDKANLKTIKTRHILSAARGALRMFLVGGGEEFYAPANRCLDFVVENSMSATCEVEETAGGEMTDPIATVDAFILASSFYGCTGSAYYKKLARRIYLNGMNICFSGSGSVQSSKAVTKDNPIFVVGPEDEDGSLHYVDGLVTARNDVFLFVVSTEIKNENGVRFMGDRLMGKSFGYDGAKFRPMHEFSLKTDGFIRSLKLIIIE